MPFTTNAKARLFDTGSQTANGDVLASDVTVSGGGAPRALIVTIQLATAATVDLAETVDGTTKTYTLNDGATCDAGDLYTFEIPCRSAGSYNIQLGSGVAIDVLNVDEASLAAKT